MKLYRKIDKQGYFIEDVLLQDNEEITEDLIETECPQGLYLPKWNGTEWIEGGTAPEHEPPKPTAEERLDELENAILFLMME